MKSLYRKALVVAVVATAMILIRPALRAEDRKVKTQVEPTYPELAKTMHLNGTVRVEVTVSEKGDVTKVEKASGPPVLQAAAKDAIKKWKFKPFTRDGQPVRATGFVNFNFNL